MISHPEFPKRQEYFGSWFANNPSQETLPYYIDKICIQEERLLDAKLRIRVGKPVKDEIKALENEIETLQLSRGQRRCAEHALADYIDHVYVTTGAHELRNIPEKLRNCRMTGVVGRKPDGNYLVAWDQKCGYVRLCPDESREETQRLTQRYVPEIRNWLRESKGYRRCYYGVFTKPNYTTGTLREGKQALFDDFKDWLKKMPMVKGALVVQEDPLSADGNWNIHLNVILVTEGSFNWKEARAVWDANLEISRISEDNLIKTCLELVKYSAQTVPTKSEEKQLSGKSKAPAITEWPPEVFLEWWLAQLQFRRTRSYGCLFSIDKRRWENADIEQKARYLLDAKIHLINIDLNWSDFDEPQRRALKRAMIYGETLEMDLIDWIGQIKFDEDHYRVDLILEDKSFINELYNHDENNLVCINQNSTDPPT